MRISCHGQHPARVKKTAKDGAYCVVDATAVERGHASLGRARVVVLDEAVVEALRAWVSGCTSQWRVRGREKSVPMERSPSCPG